MALAPHFEFHFYTKKLLLFSINDLSSPILSNCGPVCLKESNVISDCVLHRPLLQLAH